MSSRRFSRVASIIVAAVSTIILFTQSVIAGGDLYIPKERVSAPKRSWSGLYVGGGFGIQQLRAGISIDSKNHYEKNRTKKKCKKVWHSKTYKKCGKTYTKYWHTKKCKCETEQVASDDYDFDGSQNVSGDWSFFGTLEVGIDRQFSDKLVGGLFASVDFGSSEVDFIFNHSSGRHSASVSGNLETDHTITVGGRLGYLLNDKTMAYGLLGYTRTKLSGVLNTNINGPHLAKFNLSQKFSEDVGGVTVGFGAERRLTSRWSAKLEYRYTWLGDIEAALSDAKNKSHGYNKYCKTPEWTKHATTDTTIGIDPNLHSVRAVLSYRFNQ